MLPFKKILAPADFSEPSFEGLKAANELARHFSAEVRLVHAVSPVLTVPAPPATFNAPVYQREATESAKKGLNDLVKNKFSPGLTVIPLVMEGSPAEHIVKAAEESGADLIVIATHGRPDGAGSSSARWPKEWFGWLPVPCSPFSPLMERSEPSRRMKTLKPPNQA